MTTTAQTTSPQAPSPPAADRWALAGRVAAVVVLVVLAAAPLFLAPYAATTLTRILVFALLAVSLDLLVGVTGLPSLGHAAYFGAGAYAAAWVSVNVTSEVPVPLVVGAAFGALAAAATGWIAVRSHGVYFLMLTLAIGEILEQVAQTWDEVTGGANGLIGRSASLAGTPLTNVGYLYWYVLVVGCLGFLAVWLVARSPFGAALRGIRDNEPRMRALGYATSLYKYAAFIIAGAVAGAAGSLFAVQGARIVTPDELGFTTAALMLLAVVIGGAGSLWGAALGAALVIVVRDGLQLGGHSELLLGIVFILVVYLLPRGAAGLARRRS